MLVTLLGIDIAVNAKQLLKAYAPIFVAVVGITIEANDLQSENASSPIVSREVHSQNAKSPMAVTVYVVPSCMTVSGIVIAVVPE